ncbi:ketoacyl-ACP synthase III family protein [Streptomyces sp. NPDC052012]|uniref:ketoacyl-ACP synthase III family protein n=1 Tax=Streptomyces sp. NPDC052012 TaxID=3155051 RepID=UPI00344B3F2A
MRWDNIYLAGTGSYLPEQVQTAEQAVAEGLADAEEVAAHGIRAVRVATPEETGPVMAAHAGRRAVERSGLAAEDFGLLIHSYVLHQGQELWTPASFVQRETIGGTAPAVEVLQNSSGGLFSLEMAASHLAARPQPGAVLITTGDQHRLPYFDRWNSDDALAHGDGAGAVVLSNQGGFARLVATVSYGDPSLEPFLRGTTGWTPAPFAEGRPIDLRSRIRDFMTQSETNLDIMGEKIGSMSVRVLEDALKEAGTDLGSARFFVHPNINQATVEFAYHDALGVDPATTTYEWARDLGHMGAGDHLISLDHVVAERGPRKGDLLIAMGATAGFVWTVAVLEFLVDLPARAA